MPKSLRWSNASAPCRIDWRPSRWLVVALVLLGLLATLSLSASRLPWWIAWPAAALVLAHAGWSAKHQRLMPARQVLIRGDGRVDVDGEVVEGFQLDWRGPLLFARWRDASGAGSRLVWWPDTLSAPARRELRLACPVRPAARQSRSMAN